MTQRIIDFWSSSYRSDSVAFVFELISFVFTVVASLILAVTAYNPNMVIVYPIFFVGSFTGAYACYRRKLVWPLMLTSYFVVINAFGFTVAMRWWS